MLAVTLTAGQSSTLKETDQAQKTIRDSRRLTNFNELRKHPLLFAR
jgi:hypothetical protein